MFLKKRSTSLDRKTKKTSCVKKPFFKKSATLFVKNAELKDALFVKKTFSKKTPLLSTLFVEQRAATLDRKSEKRISEKQVTPHDHQIGKLGNILVKMFSSLCERSTRTTARRGAQVYPSSPQKKPSAS